MPVSVWDEFNGKDAKTTSASAWDNPAESYNEAGVRPVPKSIQKILYEAALKKIPWEKIRDEVTVPLMKEASKGTEALKDSVNSYMYRSTRLPDRLIEETVANHLRKFGK